MFESRTKRLLGAFSPYQIDLSSNASVAVIVISII